MHKETNVLNFWKLYFKNCHKLTFWSSVGFILQQYKEARPIERKAGSGKKKGFKDKYKAKSITWSLKENPCQPQRVLARKFKCSQALIGKVLESQGCKP